MAARFSKPLTVLAAALVIAVVVGVAATAAFAVGANPISKIAVHVKAHPTSCTKSYPAFTACGNIVSTWVPTGDLDVMPVFYDLTQYTVTETGLLWPEGDWGSASWVKCKGDIAVGVIQHSADFAAAPTQTNGTAVAWSTCQTGWGVAPGYAWLYATGAGTVAPAPNPATGDFGVVDCAPDPGPYYQLPMAISAAGIGGAAGDNACAVPACNLSPSSLDFGTVNLGGWAERTFTITNTGSGRMTGRARITAGDTGEFRIVVGGELYDLANGEFTSVTVRFTPASIGAKLCNVETQNGVCSPVVCTGVGDVPPSCQVSTASLSFGTVNVGETSDKTFTIKNTGGGTLNGSVSEACAEFSITGGSGTYSLTNNQTVTVTVRFAPTSGGAKSCTVETGATECADVSCTGTGQQSIVPLTISKDDAIAATACAFPGGSVTYTLSYTNPNTSAVSSVVVTDYLPADVDFVSASGGGAYDGGNHKVVWSIGGVGAGGNGNVNVVTAIKMSAPRGGTLSNSCDIVSAETPTPVTANHSTAVCACAISGVAVVCPESHNDFTGPNGMTSYSWSVSGSGTIVGSSTGQLVQVLSGATCGQTYTLTLNLVQPGGVASSCQKVVTIVDTNAPVITCPGNALLECGTNPTPDLTGEATAIDNCDLSLAITYSDVVTPGSCPQAYSIARTWVATDNCSNSATCVQTVTVVDGVPPTIVCPPDRSFRCDQTIDFGSVAAVDDCDGEIDITYSDQLVPGGSAQEYQIRRTWTAADDCGNTVSCVQTVTVTDDTPPVIVCPGDRTFSCDETIDFGVATATDSCDPAPVIGYSDLTVPGGCPQAYVIARTWTAVDAAGNSATCLQTVAVVDNGAPTLACAPDGRVSYGTPIVFTDPVATDVCDPAPGVTVTSTTSKPGPGAGEVTHTRCWMATDACGNTALCCQNIVEEAQPPTPVYIDIRPTICPNSVNPDFRGPLAIAIVGTAGLDINTVNTSTLRLHRDGVAGEVAPVRWSPEDVATPAIGPLCTCNTDGPDGLLDLGLEFALRAVVNNLDLASARGTQVVLTLTGNLTDGTPITGSDCVFVLRSGTRGEVMLLGSRSVVSAGSKFSFSFSLEAAGHVQADVFDVNGRLVKTLLEGEFDAGSYMVDWDITGSSGQRVPGGIYFVRLAAGTQAETKKVVVVE